MSHTWQSLLANLAIIAIFVSIWTHLEVPVERIRRSLRTTWLAILLGGATVAVMAMPIEIRPGVVADLRATMIVLSGFFGGPIVGVAAFLAALVYRLSSGGVGALPATVGMSASLVIGVGGRFLLRGRAPELKDVLILAAVAACGGITGFLFLPAEIRASLFLQVVPAVATLTFVALAVAGLAIVGDQRRRETERQNLIYAAVFDALPDPLHAKDLAGRFIAANPATAALMRVKDVKDLIGHDDFDFYPQNVAARFRRDEERLMAEGKPFNLRQPVTFLDGSTGTLATLKAPLRDKHGNLIGLITHNRDITERAQLEEKYAQSQRQLGQALANMADGLAMFDRDARIVMCNPQYAAMFPKTAHLRVVGANLRDILRAAVALGEETVPPQTTLEPWVEDAVAGLHIPGTREIRLADGRWLQARVRPADDGTSLSLLSDITTAKKAEAVLQETNTRLDLLAKTDGLTHLTNRRTFDEMLARELSRATRSNMRVSVLLADVDHFKAFNDTYGHQRGDECLRAIADCLRSSLKRPGDVAARYGGEEFVAVLPDTDADGALVLAEAFRQAVRRLNIPHTRSAKGCVTVTVGVATSTSGAVESPALLVRRADEALYAGKASGRDRTFQSRPEADDTRLRIVAG